MKRMNFCATFGGAPRRIAPLTTWVAGVLAAGLLTFRAAGASTPPAAASAPALEINSLATPEIGYRELRLISPTIMELTVITRGANSAPSERDKPPVVPVPALTPADFQVSVGGERREVTEVGFRRRPVYAPLKNRDLRVGNYVYLALQRPIATDTVIEVRASNAKASWLANVNTSTRSDPLRHSPAIHVNQVGYQPGTAKRATVGYFLGSLGELRLQSTAGSSGAGEFHLITVESGEIVHRGRLVLRPDRGMPHGWYQQVWEADFTEFNRPGEYRLAVPGLGASYPFFIDDGIAASFARTYALGLYHQRCGMETALPYSRFVHGPCHLAAAQIPTGRIGALIGLEATAADADLFPFVQQGRVDVAGGHHDAGDYSKYTVNSAGLIHHLLFATDSLAGVAGLDNLGLPESGDGVSDLLQIAKGEADFLAKMQDRDGGFYFLVYPRARRYEQDVLPDKGDPQIVWPKNSVSTAAAVAALAQCASSKLFRQHFPADAQRHLEAARRGWNLLRDAQAKHGGDMYRKFTHYGDEYKDADELVWAAVELYLATGEKEFATEIQKRLNPRNPETRRWGWKRMNEGFGRAIRSYAFGASSGRVNRSQLDPQLFRRCEEEIIACADDWLQASRASAYGLTYPEPTKRVMGGGWFFPHDYSFDLAVAAQLDFPVKADRRPEYREAILGNLNYEAGTNPINVSFLTGVGWKRPLEIVHQYAQNDRRTLPPGGIPQGTIQEGFYYMDNYRGELGALSYPLDGDKSAPYPILDRWGDSYNLQTEFVVLNQARGLAVTAWLMAQTPLRSQVWRPTEARIDGISKAGAIVNQPVTVQFEPPAGLDAKSARIVWEGTGQSPTFGRTFTFVARQPGNQWLEVEAVWPDGRRAVSALSFSARAQ